MSRTLDRFFLAAVLVAGGFFLAGCKQAEGERCELNSDCVAPLLCREGTCTSSAQPPAAGPVVNTGDAGPADTAAPVAGDGGTQDAAGLAPDGPPAATQDLAPDLVPDATPAADGASSG